MGCACARAARGIEGVGGEVTKAMLGRGALSGEGGAAEVQDGMRRRRGGVEGVRGGGGGAGERERERGDAALEL